MTKRKFAAINTIIVIMVLLGLLAGVAFIVLSPWFYFGLGKPLVLNIGFLSTSHQNEIFNTLQGACEDINMSVKTMSPSPPIVKLKTFGIGSETIEKQMNKLYLDEKTRVFMVATERDTEGISKVRYS